MFNPENRPSIVHRLTEYAKNVISEAPTFARQLHDKMQNIPRFVQEAASQKPYDLEAGLGILHLRWIASDLNNHS